MANNTVYANKVLEAKAKDLLTTSINTRNLMAVDEDLVENAGMTKTINTYTYAGEAEELANGVGNTTAKRGNMLKGANQVMVNKMTSDFLAQVKGTGVTLGATFPAATGLSYDSIVDAISALNVEDESQLFVVIPNAWKADLRKDADYKSARMGEVVYNGQVGVIAGLPVIATKALTDRALVMSKEAVKLFIKKDVEIEQDRDANTRVNSVYLRMAYVVALVDATKIAKITKATQSPGA